MIFYLLSSLKWSKLTSADFEDEKKIISSSSTSAGPNVQPENLHIICVQTWWFQNMEHLHALSKDMQNELNRDKKRGAQGQFPLIFQWIWKKNT